MTQKFDAILARVAAGTSTARDANTLRSMFNQQGKEKARERTSKPGRDPRIARN